MLKKISESISESLVVSGIVSEENREAYIYGVELLFPQIIFYFVVLVVALITKTVVTSFVFVAMYKTLRQYTGGFHCKTAEKCLAVSVLIYMPIILLGSLSCPIVDAVMAVAALISSIILLVFSPIENENKPLDNGEKRKYKRIASIVTAIALLITIVTFLFSIKKIFYGVSWAISADAGLIILTLRRCKHEKDNTEGGSGNG